MDSIQSSAGAETGGPAQPAGGDIGMPLSLRPEWADITAAAQRHLSAAGPGVVAIDYAEDDAETLAYFPGGRAGGRDQRPRAAAHGGGHRGERCALQRLGVALAVSGRRSARTARPRSRSCGAARRRTRRTTSCGTIAGGLRWPMALPAPTR